MVDVCGIGFDAEPSRLIDSSTGDTSVSSSSTVSSLTSILSSAFTSADLVDLTDSYSAALASDFTWTFDLVQGDLVLSTKSALHSRKVTDT